MSIVYYIKGKVECSPTICVEDLVEARLYLQQGFVLDINKLYKQLAIALTLDLNNDGVVTADDIELLRQAIANGARMPEFSIEIKETGRTFKAGPWLPALDWGTALSEEPPAGHTPQRPGPNFDPWAPDLPPIPPIEPVSEA